MEIFKRYNSIDNHYNSKVLSYWLNSNLIENELEFVVHEKIHGCNTSFIVNNNDVKFAQRSKITHDIFNSSLYYNKYFDNVKAISNHLNKPVQIYCEYYGNHIQKELLYRNDNEGDFIFFDIRLIDEDRFLDYEECKKLFKTFNLPVPYLYFRGKLDDCLNLEVENVESMLAKTNNIDTFIEGYVIKPVKEIVNDNGERMIIKKVSNKFRETKLSYNEIEKIKAKEAISQTFSKEYIDVIKSKLTLIRIEKIAIKEGFDNTNKKNFSLLKEALVNDIIEELERENEVVGIKNTIEKLSLNLVKQFYGINL